METNAVQPLMKQETATGAQAQKGILGKATSDAFLKILVAQMSHPDPFGEQDPGAFISEMSQLALLEQITNLNDHLDRLCFIDALGQAAALIGHEVKLTDTNGVISGTVSRVVANSNEVRLVIGDKEYPLQSVVEVR